MSDDKEPGPLVRITDLFGVAKPLEQLVSAIERGIGNLARPFQKRRETKADVAAYNEWTEALARTGLSPRAPNLRSEKGQQLDSLLKRLGSKTIGKRSLLKLCMNTSAQLNTNHPPPPPTSRSNPNGWIDSGDWLKT
jgi:hypothetical protein